MSEAKKGAVCGTCRERAESENILINEWCEIKGKFTDPDMEACSDYEQGEGE